MWRYKVKILPYAHIVLNDIYSYVFIILKGCTVYSTTMQFYRPIITIDITIELPQLSLS
jgi:hypothetical protein